MDLSRKISPLWGVAAGLGFVSSITALYMNSTYTPEPIVLSNRLPASQNNLLPANATVTEANPQQNITSGPSADIQPWQETGNPEKDDICNGIKDNSIGHARRATTNLLNDIGRNEKEIVYFMSWIGTYNDVTYLRSQFGKNIDACIHPTLFSNTNISAQKGKLFGFLNNASSIVGNSSLSLTERYAAWEQMSNYIHMAPIENSKAPLMLPSEMLAAVAYTEDSFKAMGQALGRPIIDQLISDVQSELSRIKGPLPKDEANILYGKVGRAEAISAEAELKDIRVDLLRIQLQDRKVMRDPNPTPDVFPANPAPN